jgi:uncharacterized protein YbbC (DUF1343 family)
VRLGLERLLDEPALRRPLAGRRLALLGHPASVTRDLTHAIDALAATGDLRLAAAFGPQHGLRGEKQDDMVESDDYTDPAHGIPVFSLYGTVRRPTDRMLATFDVLLVDLQDLGTRVYTYLTTLRYVLEAAAAHGKSVWVLDRPNPAGRAVDGTALVAGNESFVGAATLPMRHGLTLGEAAKWLVATLGLDVDLTVVPMTGYDPTAAPGFGWCPAELTWVNPSPNASSLSMARAYAGTVLLEGTTLSEGRGTTVPLELIGAPGWRREDVLADAERLAPTWLAGCRLRPCAFEPTFHKHAGRLCTGVQIHADFPGYAPRPFRPYRLVAALLKATRRVHPDWDLWRPPPYEYETTRPPIDVIDGGTGLRTWVDDAAASAADLERTLAHDERAWRERRREALFYPDDIAS